MWSVFPFAILFGLLFALTSCSPSAKPSTKTQAENNVLFTQSIPPKNFKTDPQLEGHFRAPDFPAHLEWLNTDKPFSIQDLRGKMGLLDFWTFCCINCMHVLPELKKLEKKYADSLAVIGVHSAKFENEKNTDAIRQAIMRYEIEHPVINDKDMEIWRSYGANSWPTLVLINPNGRIIGKHAGEGIFDLFDSIIGKALPYFESKGELNRQPLDLVLEASKQSEKLLQFPGKIHADPAGQRLLISDSNHNRILITNLDGVILDVIGHGEIGHKDGTFETASFHHPQGTFLTGNLLYIADTENHLIRRADLTARQVTTILGTGEQSRTLNTGGQGQNAALNSPWDLVVHDEKMYLAMAGSHQLWMADLKTLEAKPYAGSGAEARVDGRLREAALAQPSGITTDGQKLYFADSEVSSIRAADLNPSGHVETLIGEDLFVFGDVDGPANIARLQHALGVTIKDGLLFVADTYNSKIKVMDPLKKTSTTYAGTGKRGSLDGTRLEASFNEPAGITVLGDRLYIADTNNHLIRTLDMTSGLVSTLNIRQQETP